jgi:hypothetical protein
VPLPQAVFGPDNCSRVADFAPFAGAPKGLILAVPDHGPFILAATPHSIVGASYYHGLEGIRTAIDIFVAEPDALPIWVLRAPSMTESGGGGCAGTAAVEISGLAGPVAERLRSLPRAAAAGPGAADPGPVCRTGRALRCA